MQDFISSPFKIGQLSLPHRCIQGPLAGYSCAPFRALYSQFTAPAYAVSEMISAQDLLYKKEGHHRYVARAKEEGYLAYQLSGNDAKVLSQAALYLQDLGADLIDLNCGCPKTKIRKKGAGSALLERPDQLVTLVQALREVLRIPLTVKIRLQGDERDLLLAEKLEQAGADALVVHGRRWQDDYDVPCDYQQIANIKKTIAIPVIANGDISNPQTLQKAVTESQCDAFMVARAGCGRPWLYESFVKDPSFSPSLALQTALFMEHLQGLAVLESDFKAVLQSKSLIRYYFKPWFDERALTRFYQLSTLSEIETFLSIHFEKKTVI